MGGLHAGGLWRIQGPSESGRTTVALQIARAAAEAGLDTLALFPQQEDDQVAVRMISTMGLVPLHHIRTGSDGIGDRDRFDAAVARARELPLEVWTWSPAEPASSVWASLWRESARRPRVIVIDDLELLDVEGADGWPTSPAQLHHDARVWGWTIIVTTLTPSPGWLSDWFPAPVPHDWERYSDVLVELDRPDRRGLIERSGEIDMHVLRNRYGPSTTLDLAFQGHYSRVAATTRLQ